MFPAEGFPIYIDCWVMSKEAPHKDAAYKFLNFIMQPEIAARIAEITNFTSPNKEAEQHLSDEFRNNSMLKLPDEAARRTSFYIGVEKVLEEYEHIYSEFKLR
ncbi:MAG: extracellular solute-binding protein [Firmicutes bacterium]|nr:extracellular solute-binding protein [Bacillota bacterium]NLL88529.1 extracellular solute-binding protein [Bacillota bacterium]